MDMSTVAGRMVCLRIAIEGDDHGAQARFARRLNMTTSRWNNYECGFPVPRDAAAEIIDGVPGLTTDWIWFGDERGLTVDVREKLRAVTSPSSSTG